MGLINWIFDIYQHTRIDDARDEAAQARAELGLAALERRDDRRGAPRARPGRAGAGHQDAAAPDGREGPVHARRARAHAARARRGRRAQRRARAPRCPEAAARVGGPPTWNRRSSASRAPCPRCAHGRRRAAPAAPGAGRANRCPGRPTCPRRARRVLDQPGVRALGVDLDRGAARARHEGGRARPLAETPPMASTAASVARESSSAVRVAASELAASALIELAPPR